MSLLKEITDVIVDRSEPYTSLKIKGFRSDTEEEFFIQLVKEKTGWKTQNVLISLPKYYKSTFAHLVLKKPLA